MLTASVLSGDGWTKVVLRSSNGAEVASWPLASGDRPDLATIDTLARLQLVARRLGASVRLRDAGAELLGLLDLVGLAQVLTEDTGVAGSGLQVVGEAECGEEVRVEEVVVADDPVP